MTDSSLPEYVLGRSAEEYARLTLQARILRPYTERFFRAAGLAAGMRVLDVGSGMGDVAMLAADVVGPGGHVTGVDLDANVLDQARRRTLENGCSPWVTFEASALDTFHTAQQFDALVGRFVLLYMPDAAATIQHLLRFVRPGGIVAFHDLDLMDPRPSHPPCALWDQGYRVVTEAFARVGAPTDFGRRIGPAFVRAGLPFPTIAAECTAGGGPGSYLYPWLATTVASIAPRLEALGLSMPPDLLPLGTLAKRMEAEALRANSQVMASVQYGAWTRNPA